MFAGKKRVRAGLIALVCAAIVVALSGCEEVRFYGQAAAGEYHIITGQKPIRDLLEDTNTPVKLKAKFEEVVKIRQFAITNLHLPGDEVFLRYIDLHRPYVVWNVNVAPPLSLQPKTWWFPIVGYASYRGYFNEDAAHQYADRWEKKGWDVYVAGVEAYSTLGFFSDPLMNTFINEPEGDLANLIFHELAHRRLFINGDTDFNEAYATAVAEEGVQRWFIAMPNPKAYRQYQEEETHDRQFVQLVMDTRQELDAAYTNPRLSDGQKLKRKEEIIADLRAKYVSLKKAWGGCNDYDEWFSQPINNAKLNTISAYYDLEPAFAALIRAKKGDMDKFYQAVADLGKLPIEKRHKELLAYLNKH